MLPEARVSAVKAGGGRLPTTRQFERFLVQDAGFTRSEARTVIRSGFKTLQDARDAAGGTEARLALRFRQAAERIHSMR